MNERPALPKHRLSKAALVLRARGVRKRNNLLTHGYVVGSFAGLIPGGISIQQPSASIAPYVCLNH
jgi:hypothetical protein